MSLLDGTSLYRYMSIENFRNLIRTGALWFSRCDQFDDPLEGSLAGTDWEIMDMAASTMHPAVGPQWVAHEFRMLDALRRQVFVNCWQRSEYESALMWGFQTDTTGPQDESRRLVAIRSTVGRVSAALKLSTFDGAFNVQAVDYIDFKVDNQIREDYGTIWHKDVAFKPEKEIRVFFSVRGKHATDEPLGDGVPVEIDLRQLVDKIVCRHVVLDEVTELTKLADVGIPITISRVDGLSEPTNLR